MGLRIHKAIGYGMTGLAAKDYSFVDSRLDPHGYLRLDSESREEQYTLPGYVTWLQSVLSRPSTLDVAGQLYDHTHVQSELWALESIGQLDLDRCVVTSIEFGLSDAFLLIPPSSVSTWCRYDDPIDYEVEILNPNAGPGRMDRITHGIYPHNLRYWDRRTGRILHSSAMRFIWPRQDSDECLELAKDLGFDNEEQARAEIRPAVPPQLLILCEYLRLFVDPSSARHLEPIVYTYWA